MRMKTGGKPNIIFVVVDALRPKNLGCYGYGKNISPNIDGISKQGLLFWDAYSTTNTTDPSLTTIFSGRFGRSHGIMEHGALLQSEEVMNYLKTVRTLPEILKGNGYKTFALDWLGRWHTKGYDYYSGILRAESRWGEKLTYGQTRGHAERKPRRGLLKYLPLIMSRISSLVKKPHIIPRTDIYGDAAIVTQKAIDIIKENLEHNFFLFIHYWDTHFPYNNPGGAEETHARPDRSSREQLKRVKHRGRDKQIQLLGGIERVLAMYDGSIALVDQEIGKLVAALTDLGILENSLIILTADHGESLTEHDIYFDHHGLYNETIHVPLILRYAGLPQGKVVKGFVQHPDIMPTILDIVGVKSEEDYDGRSLMPLICRNEQINPTIYAEETHSEVKQLVATPEYKYISAPSAEDAVCKYCHMIHGGVEELYDLAADPTEMVNVVNKHPAEAEKLKNALAQRIKNFEKKRERLKLKGKIQVLKQQSGI